MGEDGEGGGGGAHGGEAYSLPMVLTDRSTHLCTWRDGQL